MRINVYAEELTTETEIVTKAVNQELFYGIRFFLKSPKELHYGTSDDDRSAITLWIPWTKRNGHQPQIVLDLFRNMIETLLPEIQRRHHNFQFQENQIFKSVEMEADYDSAEATHGNQR